ncbi:hypothetical protein [Massilia yuzhufengensis]|nr:hypothetical protein [Massilia yuzhufengensis]
MNTGNLGAVRAIAWRYHLSRSIGDTVERMLAAALARGQSGACPPAAVR